MSALPRAGDTYGRFQVRRLLGRGGMGAVFEAYDPSLHRSVALKVLLPDLAELSETRERFAREAGMLARLRSQHIIHIHDVGAEGDTVYLVTELVPDGDLHAWLEHHGAMAQTDALRLVAQLCESLADAHAVGIVHRDVKPKNVLVWQRESGLIGYLCDFGIAIDELPGLTKAGLVVGSPAYMAPERHLGRSADARGDIYSLGCVLWACLTGAPPYSGTDYQVMEAHLRHPLPALRLPVGIPADARVLDLLTRMLEKDPGARPASAAALGREVTRLAELTGANDSDEDAATLRDARDAGIDSDGLTTHSPTASEQPTVLGSIPHLRAPQADHQTPSPAQTALDDRPVRPIALRVALIGAVCGLALAIGAGGWALIGGRLPNRSDDAASRRQGSAAPASQAVTPSESGAPSATQSPSIDASQQAASPTPETDPSPQAEPSTAVPSDDPAKASLEQDLGCGSEYIVVLASTGTISDLTSVEAALDRFPDAPGRHYLDPASSCSNLSNVANKAHLALIPYLGSFGDAVSACEARMTYLDTTTYVIGLDPADTTATYCACSYVDEQLPPLNAIDDATPVGDDRFWGVELQHMLYDAGYNPQHLVGGSYGPLTTEMVRTMQGSNGLEPTGAMGAQSWSVLKSLAC